MTILYRKIIKPIRSEIIKWLKVPVVPQNEVKNDNDFPYITYYMYEDYEPYYLSFNKEQYNVRIQFKVVANDEETQKELKYQLRRLFTLSEPFETLRKNGVALLTIDALPSPPVYTNDFVIFDDGWDMTFSVDIPDSDYTVHGSLDNVQSTTTIQTKFKNGGNK